MQLIPAIDLKDGKCVRLRQGRMVDETVFSDDPLAVADRWVEAGARRLHLVDLDGALAGFPVNADLIGRIAEAHPGIEVQVGGGLRSFEVIQTYLDVGVDYVIIGTQAVRTPSFVDDACLEFPGRIMVGLDAREGRVATDGWESVSTLTASDLARRFEDAGVDSIVFTDIGRDGMMRGSNVEATAELARAIDIPVIASGGVTGLDDVRELCRVADSGITGAIVGRALYEGSIDLAEAQRLADETVGGR
ncbi:MULTISPECIES: 1-(5-phosphoribosyl)-5-[(5-phosphoribosylamino)methylideneamino]imidazole-4-carboxamide isomerase [Spiribacter]|jgi:phosphoribosylformimino-5-aminoimidazole carboxamide ribotide isomerase|uniref:1-(5-phosphoribosyl)-5-[(5-phosphoribosylamino)methylideneamino] imidazole-4-carboxamide isomerase n=1 Tax=Spiribacter roseus TaxID=1855875 RepID=A0ABV3RY69_9GAMM|nr:MULTISPECIES: 1-(5-phosphoribosyl)-5-[(5-phosphoribosylamino)methylideneamino]imidazole-4-carboxamide isomerase [Spiribacter]KAF0282083.1 1-(5-phosphoribosyl)-5-[(5-phosphoribosylamino)methylideneamino]imidazole-4-carboxamide isomerase [Spiribacter roseus]KAF0283898.1 1-(5-phosphoribosyl)-5-[(5-phosphoribosylamino)methylideneamino]imidazole-4-carboxamide isomerase [Spiribacter roseus]KAF0285707.1 1-(5-phosphoribosyl)-5-[(5-phosphoribosylamino)methylideneamino]imidazole-4-carboxamide isomerase